MDHRIIELRLLQLDEEDLVEDVEGSNPEEDMVPFIKDVIVEGVKELPEDHVGSSFWVPGRMRKIRGGRELGVHEEASKGREQHSAKGSNYSYSQGPLVI